MNGRTGGERVIVAGAGLIGLEVARQLRGRGELVRVVDSDEVRLEKARLLDFETQLANLESDQELSALGIGSDVKALFVLLESDAHNVFLVISARALAPEMPIISISESVETIERLHAAGATKVIDPYRISGYKIYELMHRPLVAETLEKTVFGREVDLEITEIPVPAGSFLDGEYLGKLSLGSRYDLVVLGVVDRKFGDHLIFATDPHKHRIDANDVLVVIGPDEALKQLSRDLKLDS